MSLQLGSNTISGHERLRMRWCSLWPGPSTGSDYGHFNDPSTSRCSDIHPRAIHEPITSIISRWQLVIHPILCQPIPYRQSSRLRWSSSDTSVLLLWAYTLSPTKRFGPVSTRKGAKLDSPAVWKDTSANWVYLSPRLPILSSAGQREIEAAMRVLAGPPHRDWRLLHHQIAYHMVHLD